MKASNKKRKFTGTIFCDDCGKYKDNREFHITETIASNICRDCFVIKRDSFIEKSIPKRFVVGDVHGQYYALKQVLKKAKFDYDKDSLICLGDVVDGGKYTKQCIDELMKIKNLIYVMGNHDEWFVKFMESGWREEIWLQQGGCATLESYGAKCKEGQKWDVASIIDVTGLKIPVKHKHFFDNAKYYHEEDNMLFVHGGINPKLPIDMQNKHDLVWDRELIQRCQNGLKTKWDKIFVGHTCTQSIMVKDIYGLNYSGETKPLNFGNLWCVDCGVGFRGKLCMQNIDTLEYFLSDAQDITK